MSAILNAKWLAWTVKTPPKSPTSWSKNDRIVGWWDKYPPSLAGEKPAEEREKEKTTIKEGRGELERGWRKSKRESPSKNLRERKVRETVLRVFNLRTPFL